MNFETGSRDLTRETSDTPQDDLYFVGLAASAGGLEAVSLLAQNLPADANAVYVLAQHMSPTHKSLLTELISRETSLPVVELGKPVVPKQCTIYVTPPNTDVVYRDGKLELLEPAGHMATPKPSADRLFKSLAAECHGQCVAVVLSGTGSDGSYGVQAIREAGGITIAQDTSSAKYDGMPASAIETGCVDLTLTPEQIGQHLEKILARPRNLDALRHLNETPSRLSDLLHILMARTQIDFRNYKENTINRRIARRMVALDIESYDEYVDYCRRTVSEVDALFRDLLISVTRFFRDPKQFEQLREAIDARTRGQTDTQLRVWIAGCATGEEAYSVAMMLADAVGGLDKIGETDIQIFASDIDEHALDVARRGVYPVTAMNDIPQRYLENYVDVGENTIEMSQALKSMIMFSKHNIAQDPPFINVDIVTLRNVLIYFNARLQERVLGRVHYALNPGGVMFLGTSESVGGMHAYFENSAHADKLFTKRKISARDGYGFGRFVPGSISYSTGRPNLPRPTDESDVDKRMFDALVRSVAPNGFIATASSEIIRVVGDISHALEVTEKSSLSLNTRTLRPGLREEATSLISVALKTKETRVGRWQDLQHGAFDQIRLCAYPIISPTSGEDHVLFALESRTQRKPSAETKNLSAKERTHYMREMEAEMASTQEALQHTVEELQTSNEELQSVNEELQSTNEELQATNEELETSNEELQSTNEELITVNEEMQVNSAELQMVTTELEAVLTYSPYPVLVIDTALIVRRASDPALAFFSLDALPSSGVHISQCKVPSGFASLPALCSNAMKVHEKTHATIASGDKKYSLYLTPFHDGQGVALGLLLSVIALDGPATNS